MAATVSKTKSNRSRDRTSGSLAADLNPGNCLVRLGALLIGLFVLMTVGKFMATELGVTEFDRLAEQALPYVLVTFVLAAAIPFVPGAEIGFGLLMVFGAEVALEVYVSMLVALLLAFLAGRLVPGSIIAGLAQNLGVRWRLLQIRRHRRHIGKPTRLGVGIVRLLAWNKFLTLGAALNTPGNSVLGGGGGLAFLAGASGQFSFAGFGIVAAIAVAPVPLAFALVG